MALIYKRPIHSHREDPDQDTSLRERARLSDAVSRRLHVAALRAERNAFFQMQASNLINDETLNRLMRETDLAESAVLSRGGKRQTHG